jgi:uncharacterized membrane protein YheB (UPF0754 family)
MLKKYFTRHFEFGKLFEPEEGPDGLTAPPKRHASGGFKLFVGILQILPWLCAAAFGLSFWIDFGPQDTFTVMGYTLELNSLMRVVSVSGLIGFSTNWLAIKMLFKPVYRRPIWGQGLIPAQKDRIVWQLAGGIHKHILSEDLIRQRIEESGIIKKVTEILIRGTENLLEDDEFREEMKSQVHKHLKENMEREDVRLRFSRIINEKLEENMQSGLKGFMFKTYKRLNKTEYEVALDNIITNVPDTVVEILDEIEEEKGNLILWIKERSADMEQFTTRLVQDVLERLNIREVLSRQMAHFDEAKLEQMIWNATNQQLLYIQYLGTLLGLLGGLLIWQPEAILVLYAGIIGILFGLDVLIHRLKKQKVGNEKG